MLRRAKMLLLMFLALQALLFVLAGVLVDTLLPGFANTDDRTEVVTGIRIAAILSVFLPVVPAFFLRVLVRQPTSREWSFLLALWCAVVGFLTASGFLAHAVWSRWQELLRPPGDDFFNALAFVSALVAVAGSYSVGAAAVVFAVVGALRGWFKAPPGFATPRSPDSVKGG